MSEAVAKARQCDAAGRHSEAISHLVAGVNAKDAEAATVLGKRLLIGDRAPNLPRDGAQLIAEAHELGSAEAAAMLSVLYALGTKQGFGLEHAVEKLAEAAARGWQPAQGQLQLLAGEHGTSGAAPDWAGVAASIDLDAWLSVPAGADLSTAPHIRSFPDFASAAVCRWLIDKASGRLTRALVYEALSRRTTVSDTRTNTAATFNLLDADLVSVLVQNRIAASLGLSLRQLEPFAVLHYAEGEEITEHYDFVDPNIPNYEEEVRQKGQRIVTFLLYLNDDYEAGETQFCELGISHKGQCGEGLFFVNSHPDGSANVATLHAGRPPRHGEKWIVSQFVRDRATF
ncbi:MAG TPA: 2OG-Fe(II) oxygenase [Gammaproteobacteria bacterium]|nr:2OG-Fe(II) oxygenase [Gammaproteobacteria bacterium]